MKNFLIYGAYGYTGKIIVDVAVNRGLKPVLAGRNLQKTKELADKYGLDYLQLDADDHQKWEKVLADKALLLNCAGPFALTVEHIVPVCLRTKTHYLDITGEIEVFSYIASLHKEASSSGVVLLPGVGFDVVPTDCLSSKLQKELPDATHLELAFQGNSGISRGTALSMARRYHNGGTVRVDGKLKAVPIAYEIRTIHFGNMDRLCMTIPWGDVYTAFHTTGIKNIKVFTGVSPKTLDSLLKFKKLTFIARTSVFQWLMKKIIRSKIDGPSPEARQNNVTYLWGKAWNNNNEEVVLEMQTPESYQLTALTAVESAIRVMDGQVKAGFKTPTMAFGNDFINEFEGVQVKKVDG